MSSHPSAPIGEYGADPSRAVLEVRGLSKSFGGSKAVADVSFTVEPGEFVTLLGPSGSGKTTILRLVAGFEAPTAGTILLNGEVVNDRRAYQRDVSTVFQHYALFPHLSVHDNVAFGLACRGLAPAETRRRVDEMLRLTRLSGMGERRVQSLSGGEQQRVALARSLATGPSLLLLDEPLGALDLKLRREMGTELKRLHRQLGTTFLYVTHDQEEALSLSDRVIVMHGGRVAREGTPEEIYQSPGTEFVAEFLGAANVLAGRIETVEGGLARISLNGQDNDTVSVAAAPTMASGVAASVAVRSESIALGPRAAGKDNRFDAVVRDIRFYGAHTEYEVQLAGGQSLRVRQTGLPAASGPHLEGPVTVGWNADETVLVHSGPPS